MSTFLLVLIVVGLIVAVALALTIKNLLHLCQPSEVLVFSGRKDKHGPGHYRIVKGGRALKRPLIETVDRVDLTNMIIEVSVQNAYSKGGIPLAVHGVANIKIPGEQPLIHNALERFLGRSRQEIMRVARETLEGNLRGVLAGLTPEEVNRDKEAFAAKLTDEAGHDLEKIGLVMDTLNIQNVSDDVGYLDAIGRTRAAHIRRNAQIAEAKAQADAAEVKWEQYEQGELAKIEAQIAVAIKQNEKRIADAQTKREALIAEEKATVQAMVAQSEAELATYRKLQRNDELLEFHAENSSPEGLSRERVDKAEAVLKDCFSKLEHALEQHEWLAGDDFSLADITWVPLYVTLNNARFPFEDYPNVLRWKDAVRARPSFEKAVLDWVPADLIRD